jgi:hypothetical protein
MHPEYGSMAIPLVSFAYFRHLCGNGGAGGKAAPERRDTARGRRNLKGLVLHSVFKHDNSLWAPLPSCWFILACKRAARWLS